MPPAPSLTLLFDDAVTRTTRSRIEYAFRVFAAVYNYRVIESGSGREARRFRYGDTPSSCDASDAVYVPARYSPEKEPSLSPGKVRYAGEDLYLFHGVDPVTGHPDWLGEIFEWLSASHEKRLSQRDSVGRIPDSEMIFSRAGLLPWKPYTALLMAWLEHFVRHGAAGEGLPKAPSPAAEAEHFVVCSHDIDFYFTNRISAAERLFKNLGISWLIYRSRSYFQSNFEMILKLLNGKRVGDYLPTLLARMEENGCRSTLFVVPARHHRRDPNYQLSDLAQHARDAIKKGFPVELHASYSSILENRTLLPETLALRSLTGRKIIGSRQHWLRFGNQEQLFRAIEDAKLVFDSSLGFSNTVGFRNGACFAFPPYDFANEKPHNFLEIPLAIMDGGLFELSRSTGESPQSLAEQTLQESRNRGWGGISILWHNPIEATSVPDEINQVFWSCAKNHKQSGEKWVSTDQFLTLCLPRYQNAGLLTELELDTQLPGSFGETETPAVAVTGS